jgi:hypothetical protein
VALPLNVMSRLYLAVLCLLAVLGLVRPASAEAPKTQPPFPGLVYIEMELTGMR